MACRFLLRLVGACAAAALASAGSAPEFLARRDSAEDSASCVADERPCEDGADCCGVCAYIGADTWQCKACTPPGEECIPMGNRCCDGGNKRKDVALPHPQHVCSPTNEVSKKYGITKYTCQAAAAQQPAGLQTSARRGGGGNATSGPANPKQTPTEAKALPSSLRSSPSVSRALQVGDATADELRAILAGARTCFDRHPVDTSNLGQLQGTLGSAVGCVQDAMEASWGWRPLVDVQGSASCGQCDGYGRGATVIEVDTESGNWMFVMRLKAGPALRLSSSPSASSSSARSVSRALQLGDATADELRAILAAARQCFDRHAVDISNLGQLQFTLGVAVGCVQDAMEARWGWRPLVDVQGSASCGQCSGYGRGATVIEVLTDSGNWMFVMRLKAGSAPRLSQERKPAKALQQGDATDEQLQVVLRAADTCFQKQPGAAHGPTQLYAELGAAIACVETACEAAWGWKPRVDEAGSHSCGRCEGYGLGATVVAVDMSWQRWMFVMRLK